MNYHTETDWGILISYTSIQNETSGVIININGVLIETRYFIILAVYEKEFVKKNSHGANAVLRYSFQESSLFTKKAIVAVQLGHEYIGVRGLELSQKRESKKTRA